jgi:flagellar motor component MotA
VNARKRGGNRLDMAQYAGVWGIIGALLGLIATIAVERMI